MAAAPAASHVVASPANLAAQWDAAMRRGDFTAAWAISDAVLAAHDPAERDNPALPYHRRFVWDGRSWRGRHVLVRCYHGLGDTLQFARLLPMLRRTAASVALEVPPPLLPLLAGLADEAFPFDPARPVPPREVDLEIMELGHALRVTLDALGPTPYLAVTPAAVRGIGLCWRGGGWNPARDISCAALREAIGNRPLWSLCPGESPDCSWYAGRSPGFANPAGAPAALTETAALVAGLDLIVTVDSMIAHLAGALGRPTLLLLPFQADWRWMDRRDDSPWYPSLRLLRQPRPGDWSAVLTELRHISGIG
jgi:hypothetical protein